MPLAHAIAQAASHELRILPDQETPTRVRLLPQIAQIVALLEHHRAEVDRHYALKRAAAPATLAPQPGEANLASYPIGFCQKIRDAVIERLVADPTFRQLTGPEIILKKVFVLLKDRYFQNAIQLGNLYVDVANDTVVVTNPKIDWAPIPAVPFENLDRWPRFAAVARRYLGITLYPNFSFPLAFPAAPFFAIRPSGRIDLFYAQNLIFLKDLGADFLRTRELLADSAFIARRLPPVYEDLLRARCSANLFDAFPLEYSPTEPAALERTILAEFTQLARQPDAPARAMLDRYLRLIADASLKLSRLNLIPSAADLSRLRAEGSIPPAPPADLSEPVANHEVVSAG